jgi:hypothetical protein
MRATQTQIAATWVAEGGPPSVANVMAAIAIAESAGETNAVSVDGCEGWFQICPPGPNSKNPQQNTREAIAKYRTSGFEPWTCCSPAAVKIVNEYHAGGHRTNIGLLEHLEGPAGGATEGLFDQVPGLKQLTEGANTAGSIGGIIGDFSKLFEGKFWIRIGKVLIGLFLLLTGVLGMANITAPDPATVIEGGAGIKSKAALAGLAA